MLSPAGVPELPSWLRALYPFRTRTLELGDARLSLVDEGSTDLPAAVLVHGAPTWSFLWRHDVPRLTARYRVIAPDRVGFGLSDKPPAEAYHTLARHTANGGAAARLQSACRHRVGSA